MAAMTQNMGIGNTAMISANVTVPAIRAPGPGGDATGEADVVSNPSNAYITQRAQQANTRNAGPTRQSSMTSEAPFPIVSMAARKTGRIG